LEVFRTAIGEYGVPKEMLTDNGRQYTNWRGTTNFEKELKKDHIKHIKSRPHHPMTLGKIERFWKTILNEFLFLVHFDSFENARERLALWVKYYNYKHPHQPFYMVGRLGGQNVAIRAEKGKIKMHVDDSENIEGKELVYDLNLEDNNERESTGTRKKNLAGNE